MFFLKIFALIALGVFTYFNLADIQGLNSYNLFEHQDKLLHFCSYLSLFLLFVLAFKTVKKIVLFLILYGIAIEIAHHYLPYRSGEMYDVFANSGGILLGYFIIGRKLFKKYV